MQHPGGYMKKPAPLNYALVLAEREKGIPAKQLAVKYRTPVQNIYNAISRAKKNNKADQRAARKLVRIGRPDSKGHWRELRRKSAKYPRPSAAITNLVQEEVASLRRKADMIMKAIAVLDEIGHMDG